MRIPDHATKAFKGIIFDVYQWRQKMFDGSIQTFEGIKRPNTVLVIPTIEDKVIITRQEQPDKPLYYSLVGGRQEEMEDPIEAAQRELLEETGMKSNDWTFYKTYENFGKFDWQIHLFIAKKCEKITEQHLDPGEKIDLVALNFDDFIDLHTSDEIWAGEFTLDVLRMKMDAGKLKRFKEALFK